MRIDGKTAIAGLAISAILGLGATRAIAQEEVISPAPVVTTVTAPLEYRNSVYDVFGEAYFSHDRDFFKNGTFPRGLDFYLGFKGFVENEIRKDGREVSTVYQQVLSRQMASGPIIRVFDLPNPFCQSLLTLPNPNGCGIIGCAANGCSLPAQQLYQPPVAATPIPPVEQAPLPVQPQKPQQPQRVPALW
jgi:hypothetical protein